MLNKIREMSNRILKLTYKMVVPNKEAEEKIKQAVSGKGEHGLTRDQCEDLGIPYKEPEGLTIDAEGYVSLLE